LLRCGKIRKPRVGGRTLLALRSVAPRAAGRLQAVKRTGAGGLRTNSNGGQNVNNVSSHKTVIKRLLYIARNR